MTGIRNLCNLLRLTFVAGLMLASPPHADDLSPAQAAEKYMGAAHTAYNIWLKSADAQDAERTLLAQMDQMALTMCAITAKTKAVAIESGKKFSEVRATVPNVANNWATAEFQSWAVADFAQFQKTKQLESKVPVARIAELSRSRRKFVCESVTYPD